MRKSVLLIVLAAIALTAGIIYSAKKTALAKAPDEIAMLRQEVAALREAVDELRKTNASRKAAEDSLNGFATDGTPVSAADLMAQLKAIRSQQQATQSALSSNLLEITLDRGSDAWARGDYKKAFKLLAPLAESGNAVAQHRLGVMYVLGQGVEKDPAKAVELYTKAAEQGQAESQHGLGLRLLWGDGADKDPQKAAEWFTAAVNQGVMDSATWLGDLYFKGNGVAQDPVEGYKWLLLAGDKFYISHPRTMTLENYASQLTPEQLAEAEKRAKEFKPQRTGPEDF
jgi:TPR repeat protein